MAKEWNFDKPIPRGYFMKAEDFPPDFAKRAEARLKTENLPTGEAASIHYELGLYTIVVEDNPAEATFHFSLARDASEAHLTIDADARRWILRCLERLGETSVNTHRRTLGALLNAREGADLEATYEACRDPVGLGMMVLDRLDRTTKLHYLNLCDRYTSYRNGPKDILPALEDGIATADRFLAKSTDSTSISEDLRDIRRQVEEQKNRMKLLLEYTERLAKP